MPKRTDLKTILIIGSGPIVIGRACEFDYSGTQACKALREEGYQVVLINSNPATIMTDPEMADRTYIEPITPEAVEKIIAKEQNGPFHIDALLPTLGGQTALNCACKVEEDGILEKYGVEMIADAKDMNFDILSIVEAHHERHDGFGYPRGLEGINIPIGARIAGIADSYDAMITQRPYAPARSSFNAMQELTDTVDKFH